MTGEAAPAPAGASRVRDRTVVALGGNAITPAGTAGTAEEQRANVEAAMVPIADAIAAGHEVVLTHGNGPQVGNLLIKNEMARDVVPPVPLDWCVAQTQATIGYLIVTALEQELADRSLPLPVIPLITRVRVDADDPAWQAPTKPVGPYLDDEAEVRRRERQGQAFVSVRGRGWRRLVPSPEPRESLDRVSMRVLLDGGAVVVASGGGGVPMVRAADGRLRGVEAVVDKDLAGAQLARDVEAGRFVILTDVPAVAVRYGEPGEEWLGEVTAADLRALQSREHFAAGSMGPKVEAALRFAESTGGTSVIASLDEAAAAVVGETGTRVVPG